MRRTPPQLPLALRPRRKRGRGGLRSGAGRKRSPHSGVWHVRRPEVDRHRPLHVSLKVQAGLGSLRNGPCHRAVRAAIAAGQRDVFRICHYSLQGNHIHLVVEAHNSAALSRGMQGLSIRIARGLNRALGRTGKVFADRYFVRALSTPREVRDCVAYVLNNRQRHVFGKGPGLRKVGVDPYSSGAHFDGWRLKLPPGERSAEEPVVAPAATWLLRVGWRRHGLLMPAYVPQWGNSWRGRGGVRGPRRPA